MKAFLSQCLLIIAAILTAGCAAPTPEPTMRHEEPLLGFQNHHPPEYAAGFKAGYRSVCPKVGKDLDPFPNSPYRQMTTYCRKKNSEVTVEQEPMNSHTYQQGREDGITEAWRRAVDEDSKQVLEFHRQIEPTLDYMNMQIPVPN